MDQMRVVRILTAALECSVYVAPTDPGLSAEELSEVGKRLGLQNGEMSDAFPSVPMHHEYGQRLLPEGKRIRPWCVLSIPHEPDYRDWNASEFVHSQVKAAVKSEGAAGARLERSVLVERAVAQGLSRTGVEAAITIDILSGHLVETGGLISYLPGHERWPLPSEQRKPSPAMKGRVDRSQERAAVYPVVKDIVERRSDGRRSSIEPLDAFAEEMDRLGHRHFRLWWKQTVSELRQCDAQTTPMSTAVLAAALVEGALTFVVRHARNSGLPTFASDDFARSPQSWKIDDLVKSASRGGDSAILDQKSRARAEWLIQVRQRIHAGRMLSDHPGGPPDLRPETAREAKSVADLIVRCVLFWLDKHPAT